MTATSATPSRRPIAVGDVVRIERDEVDHRSCGTWPDWSGRVGTVVAINADHRLDRTEYGVVFGAARRAGPTGKATGGQGTPPVWFMGHELLVLGAAPAVAA